MFPNATGPPFRQTQGPERVDGQSKWRALRQPSREATAWHAVSAHKPLGDHFARPRVAHRGMLACVGLELRAIHATNGVNHRFEVGTDRPPSPRLRQAGRAIRSFRRAQRSRPTVPTLLNCSLPAGFTP
jgi:hypothetical protein